MKKNGRKSVVLRVPRSNDGRIFENLFEQFLNREVFSVRKRKASKGHDHYYLSVVGEKGSECLGGALLDRLEFMRKAFNERGDQLNALQNRKLVMESAYQEMDRRMRKAEAEVKSLQSIFGLLYFVQGIGPETVEGIDYVLRYAKEKGLIAPAEARKITEAKNGKL